MNIFAAPAATESSEDEDPTTKRKMTSRPSTSGNQTAATADATPDKTSKQHSATDNFLTNSVDAQEKMIQILDKQNTIQQGILSELSMMRVAYCQVHGIKFATKE